MSLPRILGSQAMMPALGALVCVNTVLLGLMAWSGEKPALVMLVILSMFWTVLVVGNSVARARNLKAWESALQGWSETEKLSADYAALLGEACGALGTWDHDQAEDIVHRANTIGRLRQANFNERKRND